MDFGITAIPPFLFLTINAFVRCHQPLLENILVSVTVRCYPSDMACNHNGQNLGTGQGRLVNPSTMQAKIEALEHAP